MKNLTTRSLLLAGMSAALVACGGGSTDSTSSGGTGTFSLGITDAPVDEAVEVNVRFSSIEVKPVDGQRIVFPYNPPKDLNLLELQGGKSAPLLAGESLPAGEYEWIRVIINASADAGGTYIKFNDDSQYDLFVPSGTETGIKLNGSGFTIPAGGSADFTIDFDLKKSIVERGSANNPDGLSYLLKPTLRLVDNTKVGAITGSVSADLLTDSSCPNPDPANNTNVVYVFEGSVTPNDIDITDTTAGLVQPISTAAVTYDPNTGTGSYTAAFLSANEYTVAFTCRGVDEDPEADNELSFQATTTGVIVQADQDTAVDLAKPVSTGS